MMLFYVLVALQIIDLVTTVIAVQRPGLVEGNRFVKFFMDKIGVLPTALIVKGAFIGWIAYFQAEIPDGIFAVLILGYLWVCWNNLKLLRK